MQRIIMYAVLAVLTATGLTPTGLAGPGAGAGAGAGGQTATTRAEGLDPPPAVVTERDYAFDQATAEGWRDDVLPVVEQVSARTFVRTPVIELVTRGQLLDAMVEDILPSQLAAQYRQDEARVRMELALELLPMVPTHFAVYSRTRDRVLIAVENVHPLMAIGGLAPSALDPTMRLIIAHELAHALHAQHTDVQTQILDIRSPDQGKALAATREGFAMLIQARAAQVLGIVDANRRLVRLLSLADADDAALGPARRRYRDLYDRGWRFFARHVEADGIERAWTILATPPLVYAQILAPERYGEAVEMQIDLRRLFGGIDAFFPERRWTETLVTIEPAKVRAMFAPLGDSAGRTVERTVKAAHTLVLSDRAGAGDEVPIVRSATCYELRDAAVGPRLLRLIEQLKDARFAQLRTLTRRSGVRVIEPAPVELRGLGSGRGQLYRIDVPESDGDMPAVQLVIAAGHRGDYVVQFVSSGDAVSDAAAARVVVSVLDRAGSGAALAPVSPTEAGPDTTNTLALALGRIDKFLDGKDWTGTMEPVGREIARRLVGDELAALMALETNFVAGMACVRESRGVRPQIVTATLLELAQPDAAAALSGPVIRGSARLLERFAAIPGASFTALPGDERILPGGVAYFVQEARVTLPGQDEQLVTIIVAQRGRYLLHALDIEQALGVTNGERCARAILEVAKEAPTTRPPD